MSDIRLGTSGLAKAYIGTSTVSRIYLGSVRLWPVENLPDWLPEGVTEVLDGLTMITDHYVDLAFETSTGYFNYFRFFFDPDCDCEIKRSSNHYQLFPAPWSSSYRGCSQHNLLYMPPNNAWSYAGTNTNQDRGSAVQLNQTINHKAIIQSTVLSLSNLTGDVFEDYRG